MQDWRVQYAPGRVSECPAEACARFVIDRSLHPLDRMQGTAVILLTAISVHCCVGL